MAKHYFRLQATADNKHIFTHELHFNTLAPDDLVATTNEKIRKQILENGRFVITDDKGFTVYADMSKFQFGTVLFYRDILAEKIHAEESEKKASQNNTES